MDPQSMPGEAPELNIPPAPTTGSAGAPDIQIRTMEEDVQTATANQPATLETNEPIFTPQTINQMGGAVEGETAHHGKSLMIIGVTVGILVIAALGYFVVYPMLFPSEEITTPGQTPLVETETPTAEPITAATFFEVSPAAFVEAKITGKNAANIRGALTGEATTLLTNGSLKEVALTLNGKRLTSQDLVDELAGIPSLGTTLAEEATTLLYYDTSGVWPVYVLTLAASKTAADGLASMRASESSLIPNISRFYLSDGNIFQPFKDGSIGLMTTRYSVGSTPGASFNYGTGRGFLVFATSYNAAKAVATALGL